MNTPAAAVTRPIPIADFFRTAANLSTWDDECEAESPIFLKVEEARSLARMSKVSEVLVIAASAHPRNPPVTLRAMSPIAFSMSLRIEGARRAIAC
jgi:hypothetical protein